MLKSSSRKTVLSVAGAAVTCAALLVVLAQQRRSAHGDAHGDAEVGMRSLQSVAEVEVNGEVQRDQAAQDGGKKGFSAYFSKLTRSRRDAEKPTAADVGAPSSTPAEELRPDDLFIAVKTTKKFHQPRLDLLLETWISRNVQQTYIFTDGEDEELKRKMGNHVINTNCSAAHSRQALSCKMAVEYDKFIESGKKWFCHVDDDNYVNVRTLVKLLSQYPHTQDLYIGKPSLDRPIEATERLGDNKMKPVNFWFATGGAGFCVSRGLALKMSPWASGGHFMNTAEKIRLPDDCTIGYIIESVLGVPLTRSNLFHSHLENLQQVSRSEVQKQITLSYGMFENKRNIINMKGVFTVEEDPS
ncbi:hypothetical protein QTP70_030334, partial [Hemibagrus guttatus]